MEASDAVVLTLPGVQRTAVAGLESQLRRLHGVRGAIPDKIRGQPTAVGAAIILKIEPEALGATVELLKILGSTIDLLRERHVTSAHFTLPNGAMIAATTSMPEEELGHRLHEAERTFDVAVSFADEDRAYVSQVVRALDRRHVSVFYDADHEVDVWGQDLVKYFDGVFRHRSRYVVIFVSEHYVTKKWTRSELSSALSRALDEKREYVLPARFDDSDVPGLPPTIRYADCRQLTPDRLADMIASKLRF